MTNGCDNVMNLKMVVFGLRLSGYQESKGSLSVQAGKDNQ